jgi:hypothetical protein
MEHWLNLKKNPEVPEGETSLQLLQAIYRDKKQAFNVRRRCPSRYQN